MKIAIDLTSTPKNKTGIGRYLYNLVHALQEVDQCNEYYLFLQNDDVDGFDITAKNFHCVPVDSRILRKTYIRILWEQLVLPFKIRKLGVDLMHSPYFTMPYLSRVKKITTFHDMTYFIFPEVHTPLKREMFKGYVRLSAKNADAVLAISENTKLDIIKYTNLRDEIIHVTPLGVDWRFYEEYSIDTELIKSYGINGEYFLYVGTIEPRKNILRLIKAYQSLDESVKRKYKLVIAGKKGWMYDEIFEYLQQNKLEEYVHFTGFVKDEHLPVLYKGAKLFLYVSIYEGFGIPVIEGMACGVPTITSDTSSMKEIAGDAAIKVDPHNEEEIKNAILKLLNNKELYDSLIEKGKERAKIYNWRQCAEKTVQAYESVMKSR